jgi:hypothetical protein
MCGWEPRGESPRRPSSIEHLYTNRSHPRGTRDMRVVAVIGSLLLASCGIGLTTLAIVFLLGQLAEWITGFE